MWTRKFSLNASTYPLSYQALGQLKTSFHIFMCLKGEKRQHRLQIFESWPSSLPFFLPCAKKDLRKPLTGLIHRVFICLLLSLIMFRIREFYSLWWWPCQKEKTYILGPTELPIFFKASLAGRGENSFLLRIN